MDYLTRGFRGVRDSFNTGSERLRRILVPGYAQNPQTGEPTNYADRGQSFSPHVSGPVDLPAQQFLFKPEYVPVPICDKKRSTEKKKSSTNEITWKKQTIWHVEEEKEDRPYATMPTRF